MSSDTNNRRRAGLSDKGLILVPSAARWYLMYPSPAVSWWLTLALAVLAGAFLVRAFIIFHDCGHGSFFKLVALRPHSIAANSSSRGTVAKLVAESLMA